MSNTLSQQLISGLLAGAVILSGMHSKELATMSVPADHADTKTAHLGEGQLVKIGSDLHNHMDKQGLQNILKVSAAIEHSLDSRSLRLLHSHRLISLSELRHRLLGEHLFAVYLLTV